MTEITDEQVARYLKAMGISSVSEGHHKAVKAALQFAVEASTPAERPVSREQTQAGLDAFFDETVDDYADATHAEIASAYRAMLKLEDCEPTAAEMKAAIQVAWNTYAASGVGWKERIEAALRAAFKIRFERE